MTAGGCGTVGLAGIDPPSPTPETVAPSPTATPSPTKTPLPTPTPLPAEITLLATGDIMLDRGPGWYIEAYGPEIIFEGELGALLRSADITIGNLECAISERGEPLPKGYTFRAPLAAVAALEHAGFDLVSLANNHAMDYGPLALLDTHEELARAGIASVGAGPDIASAMAAEVIERDGLRIAFVGLLDAPAEGPGFSRWSWEATADTPGVAWADTETVTAAVEAAARDADVVVAMLHFGAEYATEPTASQRALAEAAIDAGAALVIGSHPHVLQAVEEYSGGLIAYSLGNFVFDGFEGESNTTAILRVTLTARGVTAWEMIPARVVDGLPVLE